MICFLSKLGCSPFTILGPRRKPRCVQCSPSRCKGEVFGKMRRINSRIVREATKKVQKSQGSGALPTGNLPAAGGAEGSADGSSSIPPPIQVYGLAGNYAAALYSAGKKAKELDRVTEDISQIAATAKGSSQFSSFLKDPTVPRKQRKETLDEVLKKMEACNMTKNFIALLIEKNRLMHFADISSIFEEVMSAERGELKGTITTSRGVESKDMKEIVNILTDKFLEKGQTLTLEEKVDPKLLAGFVVRIGEIHFDNCLASRIKKMDKLIREASL